MNVEDIARVCHEVNRAYCNAIGDISQLSWESSPVWQRDSARDGVDLHLHSGETTPQMSHERWLEGKKREGWKYGKTKDEKKKTHPCMVPFDKLPVEQQAKDYVFRAIVLSLKRHLG